MRGDIFISWPFLDQNLGAEFLSKHFKLFWMWKLYRVDLTPCQPHLALWKMPHCGPIDEYFSCFHSSCQWRISIIKISYKTESLFSTFCSVFFILMRFKSFWIICFKIIFYTYLIILTCLSFLTGKKSWNLPGFYVNTVSN